VVDEGTGEVAKQAGCTDLPIAKAPNIGSHMAIDEKQIG